MKKSFFRMKKRLTQEIPYAEFVLKYLALAKDKYPYTIEVPFGFRSEFASHCRKVYGPMYAYTSQYGDHVNDDSVWHYYNGTGYFLNEADASILTMVMLKHKKKTMA